LSSQLTQCVCTGHFLLRNYFRCFHESCSLFSSGTLISLVGRFMALLICSFIGTSVVAFMVRKKISIKNQVGNSWMKEWFCN